MKGDGAAVTPLDPSLISESVFKTADAMRMACATAASAIQKACYDGREGYRPPPFGVMANTPATTDTILNDVLKAQATEIESLTPAAPNPLIALTPTRITQLAAWITTVRGTTCDATYAAVMAALGA